MFFEKGDIVVVTEGLFSKKRIIGVGKALKNFDELVYDGLPNYTWKHSDKSMYGILICEGFIEEVSWREYFSGRGRG